MVFNYYITIGLSVNVHPINNVIYIYISNGPLKRTFLIKTAFFQGRFYPENWDSPSIYDVPSGDLKSFLYGL